MAGRPRQASGGGYVTQARWQIQFTTYGELLPLKGYPGIAVAGAAPAAAACQGARATVKINTALNGVEVHFPAKPDSDTIHQLKSHGFRWALRSKCWYKRHSDHALAVARRIAGLPDAQPAQ